MVRRILQKKVPCINFRVIFNTIPSKQRIFLEKVLAQTRFPIDFSFLFKKIVTPKDYKQLIELFPVLASIITLTADTIMSD